MEQKSTKYVWPDGSTSQRPFKEQEVITGLLAFIRKVRFALKLYKKIHVIKHTIGGKAVRVECVLEFPKHFSAPKKKVNSRKMAIVPNSKR